jgi:hypothetical protein
LALLRALGLGSRAVQQRARAGRLRRLHRGVYAVGHGVLRPEGRRLAAVLACGEGAVLSHRSAASHWGLLETQGALIDVTAPRGRHGGEGIRLHRSRFLDARDTTTHEGIPITTVPRTLLDLAATIQPHRLERALAQAQRLQLYDHRAIADVIARSNGHRATTALTKAISREDPKWTRSELEYWPTHRLIVELDGWETHRTRAAFEQDRARDAALTAAGWRVVRFTWHEPRDTIQRRLQALLHH